MTAPAPAVPRTAPSSATTLRPVDHGWTIVPHTHWDREWYLPFEPFRVRLARTLDRLLDVLEAEPAFATFTLDGQAVILDDYLELRPDQEPRLRALLADGRLAAGPAYVLPDEYLAPQEALVRNLLIGREVCRRFGARPMAVGYQPDPFGHVAQLPQILRGFGLDSLVFWRGMGEAADRVGVLFAWRGPDGSAVVGVRQLGSYANANHLGRWGRAGHDHGDDPESWDRVAADRLQRQLDTYAVEIERDGRARLLLCNGGDHEPAWEPLPRLVEAIRRAYPGIDVAIGTFEDHVRSLDARLEDLPLVEGELREGRDANILRGIDSARMYLKQATERASQALLGAETLASLAVLAKGATYPAAELGRAWRQLLRNLPHDSVSGCSVDDVHTEMMVRYRTVEQLAGRLEREALAALAGRSASWTEPDAATGDVSIVNPLPWRRTVLARVTLPAALRRASGLGGEADGHPIAVQRMGAEAALSVAVGGFSTVAVRLTDGARVRPVEERPTARAVSETAIENGRYRLEADADGTFTISDLATGYAIAGLGALEDSGDRGDEYDFDPVHEEIAWTSRSVSARRRVLAAGPVVAELEVAFDALLPARLSVDRSRRVGRVRCHVRTVARLVAGVDRVELTTTIDNRARDHRLRIVFPSPEARGPVRAEGHFSVLRRPARPPLPARPETWVQLPQPTNHTTGFVAAGPLVVIGRGLPEYEAIERPGGGLDIALTLLRCVGWLARTDLSTRHEDAGPPIEVPDAQCLGRHVFEYAVHLDGALDEAALVRGSADYRQPPRVGPAGAGTGGLLEVDGDVAFAALKGSEDRAGVVLRLYSPGGSEVPFAVRSPHEVRRVRLDEAPLADARVPRTIGAGEIVTLFVASSREAPDG